MKKFFVTACLAIAFLGFGQKAEIIQLMDRQQNKEGVTNIKIGKPMFAMLSNLKIKDAELEELKPLLSKLNGLRILVLEKTTEEEKTPKKLDHSFFERDFQTLISKLKYEELMSVDRNDGRMKLLANEASQGLIKDLVMYFSSEDTSVVVLMDGEISQNDLHKVVETAQRSEKSSK